MFNNLRPIKKIEFACLRSTLNLVLRFEHAPVFCGGSYIVFSAGQFTNSFHPSHVPELVEHPRI